MELPRTQFALPMIPHMLERGSIPAVARCHGAALCERAASGASNFSRNLGVAALLLLLNRKTSRNHHGGNKAMTLKFPFAIAAALAASVVLSGGVMAQSSSTGVIAVTAQKVSDSDYVTKTAMSDMFEIQSSELALKKSSNPAVKSFAEHMIKDHTASTQELTKLVQQSNLNLAPPTTLDEKHKKMLHKLQNASSAEFDRAYTKMQVKGHQQALELQKAYSMTGDNPKLKQFAGKATEMVQMHLSMAEKLSQSMAME
jgi:putative membrane protein